MFGVNVRILCVVRVRKNWFVGTIDTQSPKSCVCVCVCVCVWRDGAGVVRNICIPHAPPQVGVTQSPTYQRSMGNLLPGDQNLVLNWVLKLNHLFKFLEVLDLVFACICNEKRLKSNNILEYLWHLCAIF